MLRGLEFNIDISYKYIIFTFLFAFLQTIEAHLKNRVMLMNKYSVKKLILERMVYCELNTLKFFSEKDLERRISYDITSTLHLFCKKN
jgi:hypothetical protein